jgi:type VI secretion system protein ImpC
VVIDRDNFDEVMAGMGMHLRLGREGDEGATLRFRELDDFHPDRIYHSLDIFRELRAMRGSLEDASSGSEAIAEVRAWAAGRRRSRHKRHRVRLREAPRKWICFR